MVLTDGGKVSTAANVTTTTASTHNDRAEFPQVLANEAIHTELRYDVLDIAASLAFTRSPTAGANVLFVGTTRNNFDNRPVSRLSYSAYPKLALKSLFAIAQEVKDRHGLEKVYIVHRLGEVGIEEESIAIAVSSGHRLAAWRGGEEILERVKARAEIWKREWFSRSSGSQAGGAKNENGLGEEDEEEAAAEEGVWRANKDRDAAGHAVVDTTT